MARGFREGDRVVISNPGAGTGECPAHFMGRTGTVVANDKTLHIPILVEFDDEDVLSCWWCSKYELEFLGEDILNVDAEDLI